MKQLTIERIREIINILNDKKYLGKIKWYVFDCADNITAHLLDAVINGEKMTLNKRNFLRRFGRYFPPDELNNGCFAQAWATIKQANKIAEATK